MTTFRAVMELKRLMSTAKHVRPPANKSKAKAKTVARQLYKQRKNDGVDVSRLRRPYSRDYKTLY